MNIFYTVMSPYLLQNPAFPLLSCFHVQAPVWQHNSFSNLFSQTNYIYKKMVRRLDLELEGEEIVIKVVHADVTILSSTGK